MSYGTRGDRGRRRLLGLRGVSEHVCVCVCVCVCVHSHTCAPQGSWALWTVPLEATASGYRAPFLLGLQSLPHSSLEPLFLLLRQQRSPAGGNPGPRRACELTPGAHPVPTGVHAVPRPPGNWSGPVCHAKTQALFPGCARTRDGCCGGCGRRPRVWCPAPWFCGHCWALLATPAPGAVPH